VCQGKAGQAGQAGGARKAGKGGGARKGKEAKDGGEAEAEAGDQAEVREVLKAADMFRAEGLLKHCLEAFGKGLTVGTAVEGLVWAHGSGPEAARRVAEAYVVAHFKAIQVWHVPYIGGVRMGARWWRVVCGDASACLYERLTRAAGGRLHGGWAAGRAGDARAARRPAQRHCGAALDSICRRGVNQPRMPRRAGAAAAAVCEIVT